MMEASTERNRNEIAKPQFLLTGFTQAAGIRIYAFEGRVDARHMYYTVQVDLALIPGYGIRIQDLPLLCRELLQHQAEYRENTAFVFTEQNMRSHAEEVAIQRADAEHRKKQPRHGQTQRSKGSPEFI
jgi:hypothetical protein